jgi:hypothetical protein
MGHPGTRELSKQSQPGTGRQQPVPGNRGRRCSPRRRDRAESSSPAARIRERDQAGSSAAIFQLHSVSDGRRLMMIAAQTRTYAGMKK